MLAGGKGTRLRPMTYVVNKHLLPVYDEPMIFYPVRTLLDNGVSDILVISGPEHLGKYVQLLEEEFDEADFSYRVQKEPKGIAHAVGLAEDFVDDSFAVVLGDNIVVDDLQDSFEEFEESDSKGRIFLKEVEEPARYGIAVLDDDGNVEDIEEKPSSPRSNLAVVGIYLYTRDAFRHIKELEPSDRGELEITDLNRRYLEDGSLSHGEIDGLWFDAGTHEGLFRAGKYIREHKNGNQG